MSAAYQSWEVASGPTMGYHIGIQSANNTCPASDLLPPDAQSYNCSLLSPSESILETVPGSPDMSKGLAFTNLKLIIQQDAVTRGLSSLSLHPQQVFDASNKKSMDLEQMPDGNEGTGSNSGVHSADFHMRSTVPAVPFSTHSFRSDAHVKDCKFFPARSISKCSCEARDAHSVGIYGVSNAYDFSKHRLGAVIEDTALEEDSTIGHCEDLDLDSLSASSTLSGSSSHDALINGCALSSDGSCGVGESEVQSEYRAFSVGTSQQKKGLSQFYSGKSRSFSCLRDVVSLKDLAKPENPYAKRRRCNAGHSLNVRPQLPLLQKGTASISKKLPYNGKSTLALAVAMGSQGNEINMVHRKDMKKWEGLKKWEESSLTLRSYSLLDLQKVASYVSPS